MTSTTYEHSNILGKGGHECPQTDCKAGCTLQVLLPNSNLLSDIWYLHLHLFKLDLEKEISWRQKLEINILQWVEMQEVKVKAIAFPSIFELHAILSVLDLRKN